MVQRRYFSLGVMYADNQEKAARYLVKVLEAKGGKVHYSEFYDATDETALRLYAGMGIDEAEGEWIGAEGVMGEVRLAMLQLMLDRLCPKANDPEFHYREAA
jgi:hypothetical protein